MDRTGASSDAIRDWLDKLAIREVLARYAHGMDRMDLELVRSCFYDDAYDGHAGTPEPIDTFVERIRGVLANYKSTTHFLGSQLIDLQGDVAFSETYGIVYHRRRVEDGGEDILVCLRYVDRFERREDNWRIANRIVAYEWRRVDPVPADIESGWPATFVRGKRGRDDCSYSR